MGRVVFSKFDPIALLGALADSDPLENIRPSKNPTALVRVAKAGSLSYLFPSRVHRGAQEPAIEMGSIAHPLYSTTLENPFVASFILPPNRYVPWLLLLRASLTDGKRQLIKRHLYGLTDPVDLPF